ncbi:MAG: hypothetical protein EA369_05475 [Bradymonadales bacterium]|nr:MAG: hypothetical protein EA369_05475 [Bradymonadales bacterium]
MRGKLKILKRSSAQTLIELALVIVGVTAFLGFNLILWGIFDVSQKQTMLTRTQAFIELGNYSDYGFRAHGLDEVENEESQVRFFLGENNPGTRVNIDDLTDFQQALGGELNLTGEGGGNDQTFWRNYGFPRAVVRMGRTLFFSPQVAPLEFQFSLYEELVIAHNRKINFDEDIGDNRLPRNFVTGSVDFQRWLRHSNQDIPVIEDGGMIDNRDVALVSLREIVRSDPSLAEEADRVASRVNASDFLLSGAAAAIINTALSLALEFGMNAIGNAISGAGGSAAGGAAGFPPGGGGPSVGGNQFGFPGFSAPNFVDAATLHNLGQGFTFASQLMNTANLGLALAGQNNRNMMMATNIVGGVGGVFSGLSQLQSFQTGMLGTQSVTAGMKSDLFGGLSRITGGAGSIVSTFDPDLGRALGIGASGLGVVAGGFGIHENLSGPARYDAQGNLLSYRDESGNFAQAGQFRLTSDIGNLISNTGGLVQGIAPNSDIGLGLSTVGGAVSLVGGVGVTAYRLESGAYDGKAFALMSDVGGLISSASGVGVGFSQLSGNESMAEKFGYGLIVGSAVGMAGGAGQLTQSLVAGEFEGFGQTALAVGGIVSSVSGLGATVAAATGQDEWATNLGYASLVGGGISAVGAVSLMGESIGSWMQTQGDKRQGREDARRFIGENGSDPDALLSAHSQALSLSSERSPSYLSSFRGEIQANLIQNHSDLPAVQDLSPAGSSAREERPWNADRWNELTGQVSTWNEGLQTGLQAALSGLPSSGNANQNSNLSSEALQAQALETQRQLAIATQNGYGSVAWLQQALPQTRNLPENHSLSSDQVRTYQRNSETIQAAVEHLNENIERGRPLDPQIIAMGRRAAEENEALLGRSQRRTWEDYQTPVAQGSRPAFDANSSFPYNLVQLERGSRLNFQFEVEALSLMLHAERELVGKRVVANVQERRNLQNIGRDRAQRLGKYRQSLEEIDASFESRLKVAEKAWRDMRFVSPKDALQQIDRTLQQQEESYQRTMSALRSVASSRR